MKNFAFLLLFSSSFVFSQEIQLLNAVPSDFGKTQRTNEEKVASQAISQVVKENGLSNSLSLAYTNMGSGNNWYRLYDNYSIYGVNVSTKQYLGSWPLGASDPCDNSDNTDCAYPWWVGRWGVDEVLEQEIADRYATGEMGWNQGLETDDTIMGCMGRIPLRYGDIEGDGKKEVAIFLLNGYSLDFVIFSPEKHKNIFTAKLDFNDVLKHEAIFVEDGSMNEMLPHESLPYYQYWSRTGVDSGSNFSMSQGYRGFGKLYTGHFESAQSSDLLVWRKSYKSRLLTDTVKGFEKISDTYVHYKLVDGEYKKQDTGSSVVKGWLTAKNLTWKKGYPSKSECVGQEGQFITEMHDPLLNDPDVLQ